MTARRDIDWEFVGMVMTASINLSPLANRLWEQSGRNPALFSSLKYRAGFYETLRKEARLPRTTFWRARQGLPLTEWNFNKVLNWVGWTEESFVIGEET